jgi:Uma2 family endonuclease
MPRSMQRRPRPQVSSQEQFNPRAPGRELGVAVATVRALAAGVPWLAGLLVTGRCELGRPALAVGAVRRACDALAPGPAVKYTRTVMAEPRPTVSQQRATYGDVLAVPDHLVAELLDGELVASPRPRARHAVCSTGMTIAIGGSFHGPAGRGPGPGGWWILDEPELHLGEDVVVPDLAGWRRERLPEVPDAAWLELVPDWACEILSPSTARIDRVVKLRIYARAGLAHLWLVDPAARTLEVLSARQGVWTLVGTHAGDEVVRAVPFDAVALELARWW